MYPNAERIITVIKVIRNKYEFTLSFNKSHFSYLTIWSRKYFLCLKFWPHTSQIAGAIWFSRWCLSRDRCPYTVRPHVSQSNFAWAFRRCSVIDRWCRNFLPHVWQIWWECLGSSSTLWFPAFSSAFLCTVSICRWRNFCEVNFALQLSTSHLH